MENSKMPITKGQLVTYVVRSQTIQAMVRTVHRDGDSVTVEARHVLKNGTPHGAYLGFLYRMAVADVCPCT